MKNPRPSSPYATVKGDRQYWQPSASMRAHGFQAKPLGRVGPKAQGEADRLYRSWLAEREGQTPRPSTFDGTLGGYFDLFRSTRSWEWKQPVTKNDYDRGWRYIGPRFGNMQLTEICVDDIEDFYDFLIKNTSENTRYRTLKVFRTLFLDANLRLRLNIPSPVHAVPNPRPLGRSAIWLGSEIDQLIAAAERLGHPGMAIAIRIGWDTLLSPKDIWTLNWDDIKQDKDGPYITKIRAKTGRKTHVALSVSTHRALSTYAQSLESNPVNSLRVIRQRRGAPYAGCVPFGRDFRLVRNVLFPGDDRKFMDIRRSGNVEADVASADKATMGEILANGLAHSPYLDSIYTPSTVTKSREIAHKRLEGRNKLSNEFSNLKFSHQRP